MLLAGHGVTVEVGDRLDALVEVDIALESDVTSVAGMDAHLTKPFTYDELRATVLLYVPELAEGTSRPG